MSARAGWLRSLRLQSERKPDFALEVLREANWVGRGEPRPDWLNDVVRRPNEPVGGERVLNALLSSESAVDHIGMGRNWHVGTGIDRTGPRATRPGHGTVFQYGIGILMTINALTISAPNAGLE
ncbi:hypothetical protein [Bradyrhizobium sp. ORS 285]|uniref:hypothetical protein n=1 Tax=Bradyrhizobium sp. ORS 285 TaxID=115808 RepID=UPI00111207F8|nr:hypothetical protein [Bradyrhizobium sp. ORS 285]